MVTRECFETLDEKNVIPNEKNVIPNEKIVIPNEKNVNPQLICKILECNAKFARLECLILLFIFTFYISKLLPSITINYFLKNGKLIF
jgi:hypothetical protein